MPAPAGVDVVEVETAAEMERAVDARRRRTADVVVMAAAVADFRPKASAARKIKKADGAPEIVLEPTPDILAALGARRRPGQVLVGFAAETAGPGAGPARTCRTTPGTSWRPRTSTWSWPTTWPPPASVSPTTPTPC